MQSVYIYIYIYIYKIHTNENSFKWKKIPTDERKLGKKHPVLNQSYNLAGCFVWV